MSRVMRAIFILVSAIALREISSASSIVAQVVFDNMPDPSAGLGAPPGSNLEGDKEFVNPATGELVTFIPALTLPQRAGASPLVLGFTYTSTQYELRQDTQVQNMSGGNGGDPGQGATACWGLVCWNPYGGIDGAYAYAPANSVLGLQDGSGAYHYDYITFSESVIPTSPYGDTPLQVNLPYLRASIEYEGDAWATNPYSGDQFITFPQLCVTNFTFTDWEGSTHPFSLPFAATSECVSQSRGFQNGGNGLVVYSTEASDNSMYRLDLTNLNDITVTSIAGTVYHFTSGAQGSNLRFTYKPVYPNAPLSSGGSGAQAILDLPSTIVDKNGNTITIVDNGLFFFGYPATITDTIGRQVQVQGHTYRPQPSGPSQPVPVGFTFKDPNGTQQTVGASFVSGTQTAIPDVGPPVAAYAAVNANTSTPCSVDSGPNNPPLGNQYWLSTAGGWIPSTNAGYAGEWKLSFGITGRAYDLTFDSFGHLSKVVYPEGGYHRYDYTSSTYIRRFGAASCLWGSARVAHRYECKSSSGNCTNEDTNTYHYASDAPNSSLCPMNYDESLVVLAASVTDPTGAQILHCYSMDAFDHTLESNAYWFDSSGNKTKSAVYQYNGYFLSGTTITVPSAAGDRTYIDNSPRASVSASSVVIDPVTPTATKSMGPYPYYLPVAASEDQYDYDGTHLKNVTNTYWSGGHILGVLQSSTETDYLQSLSRTTTFGLDTLGNVQTKSVSGTGATSQSWDYRPLDTWGRPTQVKDGLGNVTKFSFADSWHESTCAPTANAGAYLTSVTNALSQKATFSYNSCTGTLGSTTDANTQTTSVTYDPLGRSLVTTHPDGGSVTNSYTDTAPNSVTVTQTQSAGWGGAAGVPATSASSLVNEVVLDGLGRKSQAQVTDVYGTMYVDTTYDPVGRVASTSNPYRTGDTVYTTQYSYDALDRKTVETEQDNSKLQWCYNGVQDVLHPQTNCHGNGSSFTSGEWVDAADEAGVNHQSVSDALGHVRSLMEPGPMETQYTYDAFGNLWSVNQKGGSTDTARARSFNYTGLSQLTQSYNPETGYICYGTTGGGQPNGTNCTQGYDADGNLTAKTDARGVLTKFAFDTINRLTAKTFQYAPAGTLSSCYQYDGTETNGVGRLVASWTQSGACSSSPPQSGVQSSRSVLAYDSMGRIKKEQQCTPANCASTTSSPYTLHYDYDLVGHLIHSEDGIGQVGWWLQYDNAGRLSGVNAASLWSTPSNPSPLYPTNLFSAQDYSAASALTNWTLGTSSSGNPALTGVRQYDNRLRPTMETVSGHE